MRLNPNVSTVYGGHQHSVPQRNYKLEAWQRASRPSLDSGLATLYPKDVSNVFAAALARVHRVSVDPDVMEGQPCIRNTRIPVRSVIRAVEQYGSIDGAVKCYPHLTQEQIKDALYFAQIVLEPPNGIDETTIAAG
jgi:uncharacterized protein (DUF433 family)